MNLGNETEQIEFKRSTSELREGCESIASILNKHNLNKHNSGELFFGIGPTGEVVGQDISERTLRSISQAIGNKIRPTIHPTIEACSDNAGHRYVHVAFSGHNRPYSCDGRYRIRVSDEDILMSNEELGRMYVERATNFVPWDAWDSGLGPDAIDESAFGAFLERGRERGRITSTFASTKAALDGLGLLTEEGRLRNAAAALFCDSDNVRLKLAAFANHTRTDILDLHQCQGTVFSLIDTAERYVLQNTRRRLVITGGGPREEVPEIPRQAVREAVTNAFAHMDWTLGGAVLVEIYYDDVEIDSPGWFIEGQDPVEHLSGASRSSRTRNPLIARTLFRSGDIESEGSGIPRMRELCDEAGITLEYVHTPDGTRLVLHRNESIGNDGKINGKINGKISEYGEKSDVPGRTEAAAEARQRALLSLVRANPHATISQLADTLGVGSRTVSRDLAALRDAALLQRSGSRKTGTWIVTSDVGDEL